MTNSNTYLNIKDYYLWNSLKRFIFNLKIKKPTMAKTKDAIQQYFDQLR